ncbi:Ubiquitin carboxyl-terminal hydrolase 31 [Nymphon striatum]|nr:Ubiquitin carboxyl-terminal hydrolase 31 [Nymphon striatum]
MTMVVSTDPDVTQGPVQSPRRSVSESELSGMNEDYNSTTCGDLLSGDQHSHSRRHDFPTPLTLPRFVSLRKKHKFKYVNIDNQLPKGNDDRRTKDHVALGKKKSFMSKLMGRMRRHMSLFTIPQSSQAEPPSHSLKKSSSSTVKDQTDGRGRSSKRNVHHHRRRRRSNIKKPIYSSSAHDIRQISSSTSHHNTLKTSSTSQPSISSVCKSSPKNERSNTDTSGDDNEGNNVECTPSPVRNVKTPGLAGIRNHGNTCFMNAVLQCLSHTDILAEYFVTDQYKADLLRRYKLHTRRNGGTRGELTEHLALLLKSLWLCQYTPQVSTNFINIVSKYGSQYRGSNQHDAQEFLLWLLDEVHEDLNTATKKRYKKPKSSHGRPDEIVASETLANHMRCNNSFVQDIFQAQFRSSVQCPNCRRQSNTFDPFRCISTPIPQQLTCSIFVTVVFMSSSKLRPPKQVELGVSININASIKELREAFSGKTGIPASQIVLTKLNSTGCYHDFNDSQHVSEIRDVSSVYAIETSVATIKHDSEHLTLIWYNCRGKDGIRFGYIYASHILREATYEDIISTIFLQMQSELKPGADAQKLSVKIQVLDGLSKKCYLNDDVDHPLYMPAVDKALSIFELEGHGPIHLKLIIEWNDEIASDTIKTSEGVVDVDDGVAELKQKIEKPPSVSLDDCFKLYTQEEKLGPENAWMCPNCRKLQQGVKKLSLWSIPDILVIHLKRFRQSSSQHTKLETLVEFPMTGLDMGPNTVYRNHNNNYHHFNNNNHNQLNYWSPWKRHKNFFQKSDENIYDLYAVCNHHGNLQSGHYTAVCKNPTNKKWFLFDDTKLKPIDNYKDIITSSAYLLFYHKRNLISLSGSTANSSLASSTCSMSSGPTDHWIYKIPSPNFTPPKVKSEDNLLDIETRSKSKNSLAVDPTFSRGNRAYATLAPNSSKKSNATSLGGETEHHSDDELVASSTVPEIVDQRSKIVKTSLSHDELSSRRNILTEDHSSNDNIRNIDSEPEESESKVICYSFVESCV